MLAAGEPGNVADVTEKSSSTGWVDPVEPQQTTASCANEFGELLVGYSDLLVHHREFGDQFCGQPAAGPSGNVARPDRVEHGARDISLRWARCQDLAERPDPPAR